MAFPSYSIAIRTLGTSGEKFVKELDSIAKQTIPPEKVVIYIAEGYQKPTYSIGIEEYVEVSKGMVAQRALEYREIDSDYILLLDDDVELAPDSAERLLSKASDANMDCIAADTFHNHKMTTRSKLYNVFVNLTLPIYSKKWAFKIMPNGSFSYNNNPTKDLYLSQSAAGPAALWKKEAFLRIKVSDELWLDRLGFAYGDDTLTFNKLYKNGGLLGVSFDCGIKHLDAKSQSSTYHKNTKKYLIRSMASFIIWYRTCYNLRGASFFRRIYTLFSYLLKVIWLIPIHLVAALVEKNLLIPIYYIKGLLNGMRYVFSKPYKSIPNFIIK